MGGGGGGGRCVLAAVVAVALVRSAPLLVADAPRVARFLDRTRKRRWRTAVLAAPPMARVTCGACGAVKTTVAAVGAGVGSVLRSCLLR